MIVNGLHVSNIPYVSIKYIRDEGITSTTVTDVRLAKLILRYSNLVNLYTGVWFGAVSGIAELDGTGSTHISLSNRVPIIEVRSLEVVSGKTDGKGYGLEIANDGIFVTGKIDSSAYDITSDGRSIELHGGVVDAIGNLLSATKFRFPLGTRNVLVDGAFGWIEEKISKVETELTADAAVGDRVLNVTDSSLFKQEDVIAIELSSGEVVYDIVNSKPSATQIEINYLQSAVAAGDKIISYGKPPELITYATAKLVVRNLGTLDKFVVNGSGSSFTPDLSMVISERTDNYQYRLAEGLVSDIIKNTLTGDIEVDNILSQFRSSIDGVII